MALGQLAAVTGRRIRPQYVEAINAQVPYVPALKSAERSDLLAQRGLDLDEQAMALNERSVDLNEQAMQQEYELALQQFEEQKKQQKLANMLGIANLGLKTGLGIYGESKLASPVAKAAATQVAPSSAAVEPVSIMPADLGKYTGMTTKPEFFSMAGAGDIGNWQGALFDPSHLGTAGLGTLVAKTVGKDKSNTTKALIGAGTSALAQGILSGGDPYKTIISGILGGLGGRFL